MCVEDDFTDVVDESIVVTEKRYGVGARGIDFLGRSHDGGAETKAFPVYDGHGNMIATLGRTESSPYFGIADQRSYDVWGSLRYTQSSGDPRQRYCANLGHVQDDESGLIYMRARYYEPWSGRFVSEDPALFGHNWYAFAKNNPISYADASGKSWTNILGGALAALGMLYAAGAISTMWGQDPLIHFSSASYRCELATTEALWATMLFAASTMVANQEETSIPVHLLGPLGVATMVFRTLVATMNLGLDKARYSNAATAVSAAYIYGLVLIGFIVAIAVEDMMS